MFEKKERYFLTFYLFNHNFKVKKVSPRFATLKKLYISS